MCQVKEKTPDGVSWAGCRGTWRLRTLEAPGEVSLPAPGDPACPHHCPPPGHTTRASRRWFLLPPSPQRSAQGHAHVFTNTWSQIATAGPHRPPAGAAGVRDGR